MNQQISLSEEETVPKLAKKPSLFKRMCTGKRSYLFFAFLVPCLLTYIVYFAVGTYPFGKESVLVLDLNAQYVYFFGALRRVLHGEESLIYSFSRALGGEFLGIFAYYLSSPLSFIVALFPEENMLDALLVLFTIKSGLCGLTFAAYLDSHRIGSKGTRIVFAALYALCGYGAIYQHNTMWIDCMYLLPLVALGIERLIEKRKSLLFVFALALSIFSNFYIGYMTCIFCVPYFFYAYFCETRRRGEKCEFFRSLLRMGVFSAIAVGLAACIILPTYYSLCFGKTTFSDPTYKFNLRFDFLDLLYKFFLNSYDTVRPEGLPILYCGVLTLILLPVFFTVKKIPLRQKVGVGVLTGLFIFSFSLDAVDKFWHGMQAPNWLNYRYSFMLTFILLVAAARGLANIRKATGAQIGGAVGFWLVLLVAAQKLCEFHKSDLDRDLLCIALTAVFLAIYAGALALFRNRAYRSAASAVLLVIVCAELVISGICTICFLDDDVVYSTRNSYLDNRKKYKDSVDYILENDDGFYRFDKTKHALIDTPMSLGIRGFTNSTSTLNKDTIDFLRYMGISSKSHWSKYYGATAPFDSFLGLKYVIVDGEYDVPEDYIYYFDGESTDVYQNPNAMSVAYAVNGSLKEMHLAYPSDYETAIENGEYEEFESYYTPAERMNVMMGKMLNLGEPAKMFIPIENVNDSTSNLNFSFVAGHVKYTPIVSGNAAAVNYTFIAEGDNSIIYLYLPTDYPREAGVMVNGVDKGTVLANETNRMISLGRYPKGTEVRVTITLKDDRIYIRADEPYFWYVDTENYENYFAELAKNQLVLTEWSSTCFKGTIQTTEERSTVFTSIPYDENWRVFVDGNPVPTYEMLQALVAFDTTPGTHEIVIRYVPRQLYLGLCISFASLDLLALILVIGRILRGRKKSEGEESFAVEGKEEASLPAPESETDAETPPEAETTETGSENEPKKA